jgi:hypothetical protein
VEDMKIFMEEFPLIKYVKNDVIDTQVILTELLTYIKAKDKQQETTSE